MPPHRKADIIVEPLYPRLGLLGGAPSKLAALAAARRKKEQDKPVESESKSDSGSSLEKTARGERKGGPLSLVERLSTPLKQQSPPGVIRGSHAQENGTGRPAQSPSRNATPPESNQAEHQGGARLKEYIPTKANDDRKNQPARNNNIRAEPSTFASIIVGEDTRPAKTEPSHPDPRSIDLMQVCGPDLTEAFDFAGPSPDDVILRAQSSAKGLALREKGA